jgi:hypothetical protein
MLTPPVPMSTAATKTPAKRLNTNINFRRERPDARGLAAAEVLVFAAS